MIVSCINVGLRRYKENVEYQEKFVNTYNEVMGYLDQTEPIESLDNKINDIQKKEENIIELEEEKKEK